VGVCHIEDKTMRLFWGEFSNKYPEHNNLSKLSVREGSKYKDLLLWEEI